MMALQSAMWRNSEICSESCPKKSSPLLPRWMRENWTLHIIQSAKIARAAHTSLWGPPFCHLVAPKAKK